MERDQRGGCVRTAGGSSTHGGAGARLRGLEPWLDYLIELGCNGLALGPISDSETHGYDTVNHYRIDSRLGSDVDLKWLVDECGSRGIRVLLDGVFNHVGREFAPFRDVLAHGRGSAYADWFRLDWDAGGPDGFGYADFEGHHNLVALNHDNPAVVDYVVEVMEHWLDYGVDGWRLDAAYLVPPSFWRHVSDRAHAHGDEAISPAFPSTPDDLAPCGWPIYRLHQELIGIRRRHSWLGRARVRVLRLANEQIAYQAVGLEHPDRDESVVVLLNVEDRPYHFDLDPSVREVLATSNPGSPQAFPIDGPGWAVLTCPAPSQ